MKYFRMKNIYLQHSLVNHFRSWKNVFFSTDKIIVLCVFSLLFLTAASLNVRGQNAGNFYSNANGNSQNFIAKLSKQTPLLRNDFGGCNYTLSPMSAIIATSGGTGSFTVTVNPGCSWTATTNVSWIQITSGSGSGNGTVSFSVSGQSPFNPGRSGTITVGGQTFTVNQPGPCTWSFNPPVINVPATTSVQTVSVGNIQGCDFTNFLAFTTPWITFVSADVLNQTLTIRVAANPGVTRIGNVALGALALVVKQSVRKPFDFDGDGKSDISVFRPSDGAWYIQQSSSGFTGVTFGQNGDLIVPADFDGDGKSDIAVFRPSVGEWYYLKSSNGAFVGVTFGQNGDIPIPADFDGDGKADINVFRPSNGAWYRQNSSNGSFFGTLFGQNGDKPLIADFDGDGKSDIAVFRPSAGAFYSMDSSNGAFRGTAFGFGTDIPTPSDFDGDGKTDIAVFRPSNGSWYRFNSSNGSFYGAQFGQNGDIPAAADYDGDGKADLAVFRNGNWYYLNSSNGGFVGLNFGFGTDKPIPSAFQ